ncbi:MAG TPA: MG2 domain-containing protein, partial [Sediminibacterium sp.]|nr:MG2 domain-containing protein [Sediminibacterium sp.]
MLRTLLLLPALLLCILLAAQMAPSPFEKEWKLIDSLVTKKDLPQSALQQVQQLYTASKARQLPNQVLKCRLYEYYLADKTGDENPAKNIQQLRTDIRTVNDPLTPALTHAIIAKRFYAYFLSHRFQILQRTDTNTRPDPDDFSSWSSTDFIQATAREWDTALLQADALKKIHIEKAAPLLYKGNQPLVQSTIFDLLAWEALEFYQSAENLDQHFQSSPLSMDTVCFSVPDILMQIVIDKKDSSFFGKTIGLYQSLLRLHRRDTAPDALVALDIKRLEWLRYASRCSDREALYTKALERIAANWGNMPQAVPAWVQLVSWHIHKAGLYGQRRWSGPGNNQYRDTSYRWGYEAAEALLRQAFERLPKDTLVTGSLLNLQQSIHATQLSLTTEQVVIPNQPFLGSLEYRNMDTLYLRLIKLTPGSIVSDSINKEFWRDTFWMNWIKKSAAKEWIQPLPVTHDFQQHNTEIKLPPLASGEYALLCSGSKDFSLTPKVLALRYFMVSGLSLIRNHADYFVLNRATGQPIVNARVIIQKINQVYHADRSETILDTIGNRLTDHNGYFRFAMNKPENLRITIFHENDRLCLHTFAYNNPEEEELPASLRYDLVKKNPEKKQVFFFLERKIYRPGQTMQFKGILVSTDHRTNSNQLDTSTDSVWVYLRNASYQRIDSLQLPVNRYGSVDGYFHLPEQALNGVCQLEVPGLMCSNNRFQVESYKNPRFFVQLDQPENTYKLRDTIRIKGRAMAFAGYPITGATVKYEVTRTRYFLQPYRSSLPGVTQTASIAAGELTIDPEGSFQIRFPLAVDDLSDSLQFPEFSFQVSAEITDINGETHRATIELKAGITNVKLYLSALSLNPSDSALEVAVSTLNKSNQVIPATVHLKVYPLSRPRQRLRKRLWPVPDVYSIPETSFLSDFPYDEYRNETDPASWKREHPVLEKDWQVDASKQWTIAPNTLLPGPYCIEATVNDGA